MWTIDQAHYAEWANHFRAKGWLDRTFDYSCDEPPNGCAWASINTRTAMVHAAARRLADAGDHAASARRTTNGVLAGIDMLVPTDNLLDPMPPDTNTRATYDAWLAPRRRRSCGCISRATPTAATASVRRRSRAGRRT